MRPSKGKIYKLDYKIMSKQVYTVVYQNGTYTYAKKNGDDLLLVLHNDRILSIEEYEQRRKSILENQYAPPLPTFYVWVPKNAIIDTDEFSGSDLYAKKMEIISRYNEVLDRIARMKENMDSLANNTKVQQVILDKLAEEYHDLTGYYITD